MGKSADIDLKFVVLISIFITSLTSANFLASKIALLGEIGGVLLLVPTGVLAYAVTFTTTDIIAESYGRKMAGKVVLAGFLTQVLIIIYSWVAVVLPTAPFLVEEHEWFNEAFSMLATSPPNIVLGSLVAYIISQFHDVWAFDKWRRITKGRWLWLRNNASTLVSQLIDTAIFITLAFALLPPALGGTFIPWSLIPGTILGQYIIKVVIALLDTPFVYLGVYLVGREVKVK